MCVKPSSGLRTRLVRENDFRCGISPERYYGVNQGPIILMIENFRTALLWRLMGQCPYVINGLRRAGFTGGWLEGKRCPVSLTMPAFHLPAMFPAYSN